MNSIEELLTDYRNKKKILQSRMDELADLEGQIKAIAKESKQGVEIEGARVIVIEPKNPRVSWNTKALEGFAAAHPELKDLRSESWPAPSVRIIVD